MTKRIQCLGQWDGSLTESDCHQVWWPEFQPWDSHRGRENQHPQVALWCPHASHGTNLSPPTCTINKVLKFFIGEFPLDMTASYVMLPHSLTVIKAYAYLVRGQLTEDHTQLDLCLMGREKRCAMSLRFSAIHWLFIVCKLQGCFTRWVRGSFSEAP